jgi:hypothetical protein
VRLTPLADRLEAQPWLVRFLELAMAVRAPDSNAAKSIREAATPGAPPIAGPVVIVAGGTDPEVEARMAAYGSLLHGAFEGFRGTVIGGGTREGVSGLVGSLGAEFGEALHTIGYLPREISDEKATPDTDAKRYRELRYTAGRKFSPAEPLQNWTDLLASGIPPASVGVIGINGGTIAAAEYRIALALGATVGLIAESGREAGRLAADPWWARTRRLTSLRSGRRGDVRELIQRRRSSPLSKP